VNLRLGFVAYGARCAHCDDGRAFVRNAVGDAERFVDLVAREPPAGPSSTELHLSGRNSRGAPGLIVAELLHSAGGRAGGGDGLAICVLARCRSCGPLFGIKPVVVALIAQAIWNLARTALKSTALAILRLRVALAAWESTRCSVIERESCGWLLAGKNLAKTSRDFWHGWHGRAGRVVRLAQFRVLLFFENRRGVVWQDMYAGGAARGPGAKLHWLSDAQLLDPLP